jgi:hypothetical protein
VFVCVCGGGGGMELEYRQPATATIKTHRDCVLLYAMVHLVAWLNCGD